MKKKTIEELFEIYPRLDWDRSRLDMVFRFIISMLFQIIIRMDNKE